METVSRVTRTIREIIDMLGKRHIREGCLDNQAAKSRKLESNVEKFLQFDTRYEKVK